MTGGSNYAARTSVELLHSDGSPWCSLTDLPEPGYVYHSQTGLNACGGYAEQPPPALYNPSALATHTTCIRLSASGWKTSYYLQKRRVYHSSWASPQGTILIGGEPDWDRYGDANEDMTSELLDDATGVSVDHFPLENPSW